MLIVFLIFLPMVTAPALYALAQKRDSAADDGAAVLAALELALSLALIAVPQRLDVSDILVSGLSFCTDGFRVTYSVVTSLLWLGTTVFAREYFRDERAHMGTYWFFVFVTLGAAQGVMLSADFLTTFVFFEILSLSSFPWVLHERTAESIRAACTYLAVAVIGGLILFMGLLLLQHAAGTLVYADLPAALAGVGDRALMPAAVCILLGFGAKAGMYPLHVWLPKAHPVAPAPASALLSGLLTKVGVFGVLMTALEVLPASRSFGALVLALGLVTMLLGAVLALFSVNLKRTLACSSMSQIGFILVGIASTVLNNVFGSAAGAALAYSGAMLHMVNHSLLKLVLFLSAGAVAMNLHALDLNDIRGWGRNKPVLRLCFGVAALGISGVPLFNGYLSKTLLHEGLVHLAEASSAPLPYRGAEVVFLFSGGLTFAYMLKLYRCLFRERNADRARQARFDASKRCMTPRSAAVLLIGAALLLALGQSAVSIRLAAAMTGRTLPHFAAFAWENLKGGAISLTIGAAVYLGFVRPVLCRDGAYRDLWPKGLDIEDAFYRPLLLKWLPDVLGAPARWLGENALLTPLCRAIASDSGELAGTMGENRVLSRVSHALVFVATFAGRLMESGTDALILLLRRTVLREERVRDERSIARHPHTLRRATGLALSRVLDNFSFAMMMTCLGIILIFGTLVFMLAAMG